MDESDVRDGALARVVDPDDAEVVAAGRHLEGVLVARVAVGVHIEHVAQQERSAPLLDGVGKVLQRHSEVGAVGSRLEFEHLAYDVQEMAAALLRRDEFLHLVAEEQGSDLVVVEYRAETQHCGNLGKQVALGLHGGSEESRTAHVDKEHDRQFPLLLEHLHVRGAEARRDVPVHGTDVVAPMVLTHLAERHTASLERRMVFPGEDLVGQGLGPDLYLADLAQKVRCRLIARLPCHH